VEQILFHHNGKEYTVYEALKTNEIKTIMIMEDERNKKLDPLNKKSMKKYFEDTDKMVVTILRRCFRMTDDQISNIEEAERRNLAHSFINFIAVANNFSGSR
jgi:hypoxanthine-guanine phosphoribosyltransferase